MATSHPDITVWASSVRGKAMFLKDDILDEDFAVERFRLGIRVKCFQGSGFSV